MDYRPDSYRSERSFDSEQFNNRLIEKLGSAFQYHEAGNLEKAKEIYEEILASVPGHPDTNYNLGLVLHSQGELEQAMEKYRRAIDNKSQCYEAYYNLANALKEQGRVDEAIQGYREALTINPSHIGSHHNLGVAYYSKNRLREAIACYQRVLSIDPRNAQAYYNLGVAFQTVGDPQQAIACYAKALTIEPEDADSYYNLAILLKEQGELEEAIAAYQSAIDLNPRDADVHYNLGIAYADNREPEKAIACYRQTLTLDPGYAPAYSNLGVVCHQLGKTEEAIDCYRQALEMGHNVVANTHILAALTGEKTDSAPAEYICNLFDHYAARFDHSLITELEYQVPMLLSQALAAVLKKDLAFAHAVDLGCGTGLSGLPFKNGAQRLSGVDLSTRILQLAEEKNIYDLLHCGDLVEFLEESQEKYDLFVAADVVIYLGDLRPLFKAVQQSARPGAYFALSTENCREGDWQLRPSGRYAHSLSYIEQLAGEQGFRLRWHQTAGIRKEKGEWIEGDLVILESAGS